MDKFFESCCTSREQMGIYCFLGGLGFFDNLSQNIPLQNKPNLIFCNIFGSAVTAVGIFNYICFND